MTTPTHDKEIEEWKSRTENTPLPFKCRHGLERITARQCLAYQSGSLWMRRIASSALKFRRDVCRTCPGFSTPGLTLRANMPGQEAD